MMPMDAYDAQCDWQHAEDPWYDTGKDVGFEGRNWASE
jgi:hypothetical protein